MLGLQDNSKEKNVVFCYMNHVTATRPDTGSYWHFVPASLILEFHSGWAFPSTGAGSIGLASQSRIVWSPPAEASHRPSGLNATFHTSPACPVSVNVSWPVAASQTRSV